MRGMAQHGEGFHLCVRGGLEATTGFEPVMGVLQTPALPLGYVARHTCAAGDENPPCGRMRRYAHVGAEEEI